MDRRRWLACAAGSAVLGAAGRAASQGAKKRLAVFHPFLDQPNDHERFARIFEPLGFRAGVNLEIAWFEFPVRSDWNTTIPPVLEEMIAWRPDCIHTGGELWMRFVHQATRTIPIVGVVEEGDPVALGFAKSLARPGGNVTGVHLGARELHLKRLDLLRRLVPNLSTVAWISFKPQLLWFPTFEEAAKDVGLRIRQVVPPTPRDGGVETFLDAEFAKLEREGVRGAHFYAGIPAFIEAVRERAIRHRIALSHAGGDDSVVARDGILFTYKALLQAGRYTNQTRSVAIVARILRGEDPAHIPFEGPVGHELRVNLRTAQRIGVAIPPEVRLVAAELIS